MLACLILLIACTILSPLLTIALFRRFFEAKQAEITQEIVTLVHLWVDPTPDGKASKVALYAEALGECVGSSAARSLVRTAQQLKSSESVVVNGIQAKLEAEDNPIMDLLTGSRRGKGAAFERLVGMASKYFTQHKSNGGDPGSGQPTQSSFSL
jgi:hypothetical protein